MKVNITRCDACSDEIDEGDVFVIYKGSKFSELNRCFEAKYDYDLCNSGCVVDFIDRKLEQSET
ncbi:unnamed protein product [marine sediment metagenome]|uniref:Uncharacterized protein n=1 Tax=marine sediment metagenome TaxID=412755 RepID=X0WLP8_9ZZZZ